MTFKSSASWLCLRGSAMIENDIMRVERVPFMWKVLVFRIAQAEGRERILSDWETIFGILPSGRRKATAVLGQENAQTQS